MTNRINHFSIDASTLRHNVVWKMTSHLFELMVEIVLFPFYIRFWCSSCICLVTPIMHANRIEYAREDIRLESKQSKHSVECRIAIEAKRWSANEQYKENGMLIGAAWKRKCSYVFGLAINGIRSADFIQSNWFNQSEFIMIIDQSH